MTEQTTLGFDMTPRPIEPLTLPPSEHVRDENRRPLYACRHAGLSVYAPHRTKPGGRAANGWSPDVSFWGPWTPWKHSSGKLVDDYRGRLFKPWLLSRAVSDTSPRVAFRITVSDDTRTILVPMATRLALKAADLPGGRTVDLHDGWHAYAWQMLLARKGIVGSNAR